MPDDTPWTLATRTERVGDLAFDLEGLVGFEQASAELYRSLGKGLTPDERVDLSPMFGVIWGAARAVAARLHALGPELAGVRMLELGCGLALPSLVAAHHGADVLATDFHADAAGFLARNAARHGVAVPFRRVDWRALDDDLLGAFPWVIGSDILYAHDLPDLVAATYRRTLAPGGVGWLADPGRSWLDEFVDAAAREGLAPEVVVDRVEGPAGPEDTFLVMMRRG